MENDVSHVAHTEFQPIIALQFLALNSLTIYESAMFTALVDDVELTVFRKDECVVAGNARIGNHQILINFSPYGERSVV